MVLQISCKKNIPFDIEKKTNQLIVDGKLVNDSLFKVQLSLTQSITDNSILPIVDNASIEVFDIDTNIVAVLSHQSNGIYQSLLEKVKPNTFYLFKISFQNLVFWGKEFTADSLKIELKDTFRGVFQGKTNVFQIKFKLKDNSLLSNFYGLKVKKIHLTNNGTIKTEEWCEMETIDFILTENLKSRYSKKNLLFTDQFFNNQEAWLNIGLPDLFSNPDKKLTQLIIYSSSLSENTYQYYSSINEHVFYQNDPFSQPPLIYSNIDKSFGSIVSEFVQTDTIYFRN